MVREIFSLSPNFLFEVFFRAPQKGLGALEEKNRHEEKGECPANGPEQLVIGFPFGHPYSRQIR